MPEPTPAPAPAPQGTPAPGTPPATPPAPPTPPASSATPSLLAGGDPAPPGEPAPAKTVWGDDWREQYSGTDDKRLGLLKRYASPKDVLDAHFALKQRVDAGELKSTKPLPPNANSQEVSAWRKENGVPDNAGDYLQNLPNGLVIGEADKPKMTSFAEAMHKANMPASAVHQAIAWYNSNQEQQDAEVAKADTETRAKTEDTLRAEWGRDYRTNMNVAKDFLVNTAGAELADQLMEAVLPDGSRVGDNASALQWLARSAREVNPVSTLVPSGAGDVGATLGSEIEKIEKFMKEKPTQYFKDQAQQDRLLQLYEARDRLKKKAG
jgi:hypothetical protein